LISFNPDRMNSGLGGRHKEETGATRSKRKADNLLAKKKKKRQQERETGDAKGQKQKRGREKKLTKWERGACLKAEVQGEMKERGRRITGDHPWEKCLRYNLKIFREGEAGRKNDIRGEEREPGVLIKNCRGGVPAQEAKKGNENVKIRDRNREKTKR